MSRRAHTPALDERTVEKAAVLWQRDGIPLKAIAQRFGVTQQTISRALRQRGVTTDRRRCE